MTKLASVFPLLFATAIVRAADPIPSGEFQKIQLTNEFWAEGSTFGDFNHDGKMDISYGPYWWEGPDFKKRHAIYPDDKKSKVKKEDGTEVEFAGYIGALGHANEYADNFFEFAHDFNGDGWADIMVIGFPGKEAFWYENPKGGDGPWKKHLIWDVVDDESPTLTDLKKNGKPVLVCASNGYLGYAEPDAKDPNAKWTWHNISPKGSYQRYTHGLGVGDVNGDGRLDILEATGWWEQPASLEGDPVWKKHEAMFGKGGAQMFAYDVNGDGKADIITSIEAHGYGLVWFEQTSEGGAEGWTKHVIVGTKAEENPQGILFTEPHAIDLVDMNGDGLKDIITGKRFWAHGPSGDPDANGKAVLYWFELKRTGHDVQWVAHLIDDDSGVGTQVTVGDVNGDGKPDVVMGNKKGAFLFLRK